MVVKGLRSKDLSHREKARKAMIKIFKEVSPRYLNIAFESMSSILTKGFQQHVQIFTIHHLYTGLAEAGVLKPGCVSNKDISLTMNIMLSELFGELDEEK
jgi:U3 small nucleolar RNA-associated protein 20